MNHFPLAYGLIDDDDSKLIIELWTFSNKIKKEVIEVIDFSFISWQDVMKEEPIIC